MPEWVKRVLFIRSENLIKERSESILIRLNKINTKYLKEINHIEKAPVIYDAKSSNHGLCNNNTISGQNKINIDLSNLANVKKTFNLSNIKESRRTSKQHVSMHRMFKLIKYSLIKMEEEKIRLQNYKNTEIEWKEVARRIEYIFFTVTFLIIVSAPVWLFGKFFMRDVITKSYLDAPCGCEHSFVKNV